MRMMVVAGPIQYDAAVDPEIAKQKIKTHSEVAGQANVCIFPDLNTGNNTYKARFSISCLQCSTIPNRTTVSCVKESHPTGTMTCSCLECPLLIGG